MKMNKENFLKTELGSSMVECAVAWDQALEADWISDYESKETKSAKQTALWCQAQWEVFQMAVKQFYGIEYHFTRTDEYFGICTEDESDFLLKVEREDA